MKKWLVRIGLWLLKKAAEDYAEKQGEARVFDPSIRG